MNFFYLDASALVKRYHPELGSDVVNLVVQELLDNAPERLAVSRLILAETISVINRVRNANRISVTVFQTTTARLLLDVQHMSVQSLNDQVVLQSIPFIARHNVNSSDAIHLRQALNLQQSLLALGHDLYLITSDHRLLRAAQMEGLRAFDPETVPIAQAASLLATSEEADNST